MDKKRVVIIGGGPSGMSTAWNLVHGERANEVDVTVYTMGWRLGGKGATGRSPDGRIQEHGIHGFAGFYWNSTQMLNDSYIDLYGQNPPAPGRGELANSIESALVHNEFSISPFFADGSFTEEPMFMPGNDDQPWERPIEPTTDDVIETIFSMLADAGLHREVEQGFWEKARGKRLLGFLHRASKFWVTREIEEAIRLAATADHDAAIKRLDRILGRLLDQELDRPGAARSRFIAIDFLRTLAKGIIDDGVLDKDFEIDRLDGENYLDWLARHGAHDVTLRTGTPNAPAFICFLFPNGDGSMTPEMSAASWLQWMIRGFMGKGSPYMFFRSGTGETVIKPFFESAKKHGAKVEFFHKLKNLELSPDGSTVDRIVFRRQARLAPDRDEYEPMVEHAGIAGPVWPAAPDWDQLHPDDVAGIFAAKPEPLGIEVPAPDHADLESYWSAWKGVDDVVLVRGRDFDHVVLATPPSTFPYVCPQLVSDKQSVLHRVMTGQPTCATVGVQLWMDKTMSELGWDRELEASDRYMGASFPSPYNVMVDFSDLIEFEGWPTDGPKSLLYMCGPLADFDDPLTHDFSDHRYPELQLARAITLTSQYIGTAATWLPNAANGRPADTLGLDPQLLHASEDSSGVGRLTQQYLKVNIDPSERYVMAPANSASSRPQAWGSGVDNLAFAGDWIYTGINVGSFEGAATSGKLAAHALTGLPTIDDIAGFTFLHGDLDVDAGEPLIDRRLPAADGLLIDLTSSTEAVSEQPSPEEAR